MRSPRLTDDSVLEFAWEVSGDQLADNPFDFCLTDIRPILAGAGLTNPQTPCLTQALTQREDD
jgi:hypothetical protein